MRYSTVHPPAACVASNAEHSGSNDTRDQAKRRHLSVAVAPTSSKVPSTLARRFSPLRPMKGRLETR